MNITIYLNYQIKNLLSSLPPAHKTGTHSQAQFYSGQFYMYIYGAAVLNQK